MQTWKSSTLFVIAAFSVSVVLLFTKADMMRERASAGRPLVTHHIYSPAAADPELRNPEHAARMTRREEPQVQKTRAVIVRQPETRPVIAEEVKSGSPTSAAAKTAAAPTPAAEKQVMPVKSASAKTSTTEFRPPASHTYYIVASTFDSREKAERGLADLQRRGLNESFIGVFNEGKYVSVIARAFPREDQARIMLNELKSKHNIEGYIYHKVEE